MRKHVKTVLRLHHYSIGIEKSYWHRIYFIRFYQLRHPQEFGAIEVNPFLIWLASLFRQSYRP
ncbi:phage integrase N-terminal SAM-like domain-containing protein [Aeromonas salmonicida]|uniref:phage integrase N-terminal SAM-like domain-containing protein n=1 Tax=Aeromonas salmonicida TaxID=645 RepID=UPI00338E881A